MKAEPTPQTDLLLEQQIVCKYKHDMVSAGFARTLERERNNLKQEVERLKTMSVCELGAHNDSVRDYMEHWEGRALTAERERDDVFNILWEINDWINVAARRPRSEITTEEAAAAINVWGDKIRAILEVAQ